MRDPNPSKPADERSEKELVAAARAGEAGAFDALLLRYQDRVFSMARRILGHREDAADLAQDVFVTVFQSLDSFEEKAQFGTWLYRVTVNRCRDELRRRGTVKHTRPASLDAAAEDGPAREPAGAAPQPIEVAQARETQAAVERAIEELPEDAREALVLRDTQDLSYDDIAEVLGIPVGTVRSRLNRARTLLRDKLQPLLGGEA